MAAAMRTPESMNVRFNLDQRFDARLCASRSPAPDHPLTEDLPPRRRSPRVFLPSGALAACVHRAHQPLFGDQLKPYSTLPRLFHRFRYRKEVTATVMSQDALHQRFSCQLPYPSTGATHSSPGPPEPLSPRLRSVILPRSACRPENNPACSRPPVRPRLPSSYSHQP